MSDLKTYVQKRKASDKTFALNYEKGSARSYQALVAAIRKTIERGKSAIHRVEADTYWTVGKLIKTDILKNQKRAGYGEHLFEDLEKSLQIKKNTLHQTVQFYETYPAIVHAREQLTWSHYRELIAVDDPRWRKRLEREAVRKKLSSRELKMKIKSGGAPLTVGIAAKPFDVIPVKTGIPIKKLTPRKGILYTYTVATAEIDDVIVDCGFKFTRRIPQPGIKKITAGDIIRSEWKDKKYIVTPVDETVLASPKGSSRSASQRLLYTYNAEVLKIIDADTLRVNIDLGFDSFADQILRLRGINAPELDTEVGKAAKAFVQNAFKDLKAVLVRSSASDKYDRYLADVFYGKEETFLNQELLDLGLAEGYAE